MMYQKNPYEIMPFAKKGSLEKFPCSILALGLALMKSGATSLEKLGVTVDEYGYCQLRNMGDAIKIHFKVKAYRYYQTNNRKKLTEYITFPGKYIVCVKGHYIYVEDSNYYSFFDNLDDYVVAYWALDELLSEVKGND